MNVNKQPVKRLFIYIEQRKEVKFFMPRDNIILQCTECKERNYVTTKNKKTTPERLEFKKYCRRCRCHRVHKENK